MTDANLPMILAFAILGVTVALFVFTKLRADLVALLSLLALYLSGILTTQQALAGFADSTVIMVAALFVVGEGLARTGITAWLGQFFMRQAGDSETRLLLVIMVGTAALSAFLSNTGTVAMLLPAVVAAAWRIGSLPSKFLIPMAFAANLGGLITLIGSPPNIVVSDTLANAGYGSIGFFEFAIIGIPLTIVAAIFILAVGRRLLPARASGGQSVDLEQSMAELAQSYRLAGKLYRMRVRNGSELIGKTLAESGLGQRFGISVMAVERSASPAQPVMPRRASRLLAVREPLDRLQSDDEEMPGATTRIQAQDLLLVKGNPQVIETLPAELGVGVEPVDPANESLSDLLLSQEIGVAELILTPRSDYAGLTVSEARLADSHELQVLTLRRGEKVLPRQETRLEFGDALLVRGKWETIDRVRQDSRNFVVVGEPEAMARQVVKLTRRSFMAVLVLLAMVGLMLFDIVPTVIAVLLAAVAMVLTRCVTPEGAYRSVNWQTVVLIAAMLPMSTALEVTGGASLIANALVGTLGTIGPIALMAGVYLLTTGFSQVMSNTATTVLVAPIVLQAAISLGVAPEPMLMMVAVGAAAAFLTPIASPTNTLVFVPGGYQWGDYAKLGLALVVLVLLVSLVIVPLAWPL